MAMAAQLLPVRGFPMLEQRRRLRNDFFRAAFARLTNNELCFKYVNRRYRAALARLDVPKLGATAARIADELERNGIALAELNDFFPPGFFAEIKAEFDALLSEFRRTHPPSSKGKAAFLDTIYKAHIFTPGNVISNYLGNVEYAAIAARYMKMVPRFVGNSFWHTKPAPAEERIYSQLWHRDYNDRRLVKVFLYLTDVGAENGCFEYIAGTHAVGPLGDQFDRIGKDGYREYPEQSAVEGLVSQLPVFDVLRTGDSARGGATPSWHGCPAVVRCTGAAGTLVFADTFGLHRGGYVVSGCRDVIMTTYSTNYNIHKPHFSIGRGFETSLAPFMRMVFGLT